MAFHSYRISQPRTTAGSLRNEIQEAMKNDKRRPRLETIGENHFVISVGQGRNARFYRVPYQINEYGVLNLDFTQETQINEAQQNGLLQQAASAAIQHLSKGENTMEQQILGPPGVYDNTEQKQDLEQLQEQAEQQGKLLPAHMNRSGQKSAQQREDGNVLLPTGMNK